MINFNIKASGPLFDKKGITKKIIQESLKETADWAENQLRIESPIKTGRLKAGWYVIAGQSSIRIDNPVEYTQYVERKVNLVAKTVPQVKSKLNETLLKKTDKLK